MIVKKKVGTFRKLIGGMYVHHRESGYYARGSESIRAEVYTFGIRNLLSLTIRKDVRDSQPDILSLTFQASHTRKYKKYPTFSDVRYAKKNPNQ